MVDILRLPNLPRAETRYQMIEKVALALFLTARRMHPYFQTT